MEPTDGNLPGQDAAPGKPAGGKPPRRLELSRQELETILQHAKAALNDQEFATLQGAVETLAYLTSELEKKHVSLLRLRQMLFGATTETTAKVLEKLLQQHAPSALSAAVNGALTTDPSAATDGAADPTPEKARGHGRNGAAAYAGATLIHVPLTK